MLLLGSTLLTHHFHFPGIPIVLRGHEVSSLPQWGSSIYEVSSVVTIVCYMFNLWWDVRSIKMLTNHQFYLAGFQTTPRNQKDATRNNRQPIILQVSDSRCSFCEILMSSLLFIALFNLPIPSSRGFQTQAVWESRSGDTLTAELLTFMRWVVFRCLPCDEDVKKLLVII